MHHNVKYMGQYEAQRNMPYIPCCGVVIIIRLVNLVGYIYY